MLEIQVVIQRSEFCLARLQMRIGATLLTALIYFGTFWSH
jgi:hypothetical protein